jgi:hypothetical protein
MIRLRAFALVCFFATAAVLVSGRGPVQAGANPEHKIAIHVVAHGLACKTLPTFTECSQITTTYAGTGDIDVVPVFFNLSEYLAVEFGLTWPAEWGSCAYTTCTSTLDVGSITNPGDGMASAWTTCQTGWYVCPGYGWLNATGAGRVSIVPNPATEDYGVVDCADSPGPYQDLPDTAFAAGVGGVSGDNPCAEVEGGGEETEGQSGEIQGYYKP